MRDDRHGGDRTDVRVNQESRRDQHAIAEVVDAVAHQHAPAPATRLLGIETVVVVVVIVLVMVPVAVQLGFFQQEEEHQAAQQGQEQRMRLDVRLECLGQHVQQGRAQQHAGGQAHEVANDQAQQRGRQGRSQQNGNQAAEQRGGHDVSQGHVIILATVSNPPGLSSGDAR